MTLKNVSVKIKKTNKNFNGFLVPKIWQILKLENVIKYKSLISEECIPSILSTYVLLPTLE